jgi:hypothetical protein
MQQPVVVTLPHKLGRAEARQRIAGGIGKLTGFLPGPAAEVASRWDGDRLTLDVKAMGQALTGTIDVEEHRVRLEMMLPPMLALFGEKIAAALRYKVSGLLEDKSKP